MADPPYHSRRRSSSPRINRRAQHRPLPAITQSLTSSSLSVLSLFVKVGLNENLTLSIRSAAEEKCGSGKQSAEADSIAVCYASRCGKASSSSSSYSKLFRTCVFARKRLRASTLSRSHISKPSRTPLRSPSFPPHTTFLIRCPPLLDQDISYSHTQLVLPILVQHTRKDYRLASHLYHTQPFVYHRLSSTMAKPQVKPDPFTQANTSRMTPTPTMSSMTMI